MILFSLGISMVAAVGLTVTNIESGIAESVAKKEISEIFLDIKQRLSKELNFISWDFSINSIYSYEFQLDLPTLLARRYTYEINVNPDENGNYYLEVSGDFIGSTFDTTESLGLLNGNYVFSGSFDSVFNIHWIKIEKVSNNQVSITLSSSNS